jgi:hypothetical protein
MEKFNTFSPTTTTDSSRDTLAQHSTEHSTAHTPMEHTATHVRLLEQDGARILVVADIRGHFTRLNELAQIHKPDAIVHTGNFGFLDEHSVARIHESYLRHIVEFSPLLPQHLILQISQLSKVSPSGDSVHHLSNDNVNLKTLLQHQNISQLPQLLSGELTLDVPVYTIYGMCEDSYVINRFRYGVYNVPNLHIIDDCNMHRLHITTATGKQQSILLTGIGGALSYHKLFHQGTTHNFADIVGTNTTTTTTTTSTVPDSVIPISGDPGNIWITILQLGRLIQTLLHYSESHADEYNKAIKIFITHQSPTREPLLEHLSIFFKMDYTISNSLHFKYISSYNALTVNPSFEAFKLKFADARLKLAKIWTKVQKKYEKLLLQLPTNTQLALYVDLALAVYDKIPVSSKPAPAPSPSPSPSSPSPSPTSPTSPSDNDTSALSLSPQLIRALQTSHTYDVHDLLSKHEVNMVIRHLNDLYYVAFQHSWHYNLCDVSHGHLLLNYNAVSGRMAMTATADGFDFAYRSD